MNLSNIEQATEQAIYHFESSQQAMAECLFALFKTGECLSFIRDNTSSFSKWAQENWRWSRNWAYNAINVYERLSQALPSDQTKATIANFEDLTPTTLVKLCQPKNKEIAATVIAEAQQGVKVSEQDIKQKIKEVSTAKKEKRSVPEYVEAGEKTGCVTCVHYERKGGKQKCLFHDQLLVRMDWIDQQEGCVELTTELGDTKADYKVELDEECWRKIYTGASKRKMSPEVYARQLILEGAANEESREEMARTIEILQNELEGLRRINHKLSSDVTSRY